MNGWKFKAAELPDGTLVPELAYTNPEPISDRSEDWEAGEKEGEAK